MIFFLVSCNIRGDTIKEKEELNLPFRPDELENTWEFPEGLLLERVGDSDHVFYFYADREAKMIVGTAYNAEFEKREGDELYFISQGTETPHIAFPRRVIYNLKTGASKEETMVLDVQTKTFFGVCSPVRLLRNFEAGENDITVIFGTKDEAKTGGPVIWGPFTETFFDENSHTISFSFFGTEITKEAAQEIEKFSGNLLIKKVKAIQKEKGEPSGYLLEKLLEKRILYPQESIISTMKETPSLTLAITINGNAKYMVKEHMLDVTKKSKTPRLSIIFYR
jgi:uncharacterized protein YlzI (FlbEa/FlbD family)